MCRCVTGTNSVINRTIKLIMGYQTYGKRIHWNLINAENLRPIWFDSNQVYCQFIIIWSKDIISIEKESANEHRAKRIGANYQPYWIQQ